MPVRWAGVAGLLLVVMGVIGYTRLTVRELPKVDPPIVSVDVTYPGASAEIVESQITQVLALCGHGFYDKLRRHPKVLETFRYIVNGGEAMQRNEIRRSFDWADITWYDWKQTRNSPLAVGENEVRFVLRNANGMFGVAFAPGESLDTVNQPGQDVYSIIMRDTERNFWVQPELYSYPLHYCRRPDLLLRGIAF